MELPIIEWYIENRLTNGNPEYETARVWNLVLNRILKFGDGYSTGFETMAGISTNHLALEVKLREKIVFVIKCIAPDTETKLPILQEQADQLKDYLKAIKTHRRKFGAIAAGKTVRFYELRDGDLVDFEDDSSTYYLDRQCASVSRKLGLFTVQYNNGGCMWEDDDPVRLDE